MSQIAIASCEIHLRLHGVQGFVGHRASDHEHVPGHDGLSEKHGWAAGCPEVVPRERLIMKPERKCLRAFG